MTTVKKDDLFYVCSLIEFTGRKTKNRRKVIVNALGEQGIAKQLQDAPVNHCLSFDQVSEELINTYHIKAGDFISLVSLLRIKSPLYNPITSSRSDCLSN